MYSVSIMQSCLCSCNRVFVAEEVCLAGTDAFFCLMIPDLLLKAYLFITGFVCMSCKINPEKTVKGSKIPGSRIRHAPFTLRKTSGESGPGQRNGECDVVRRSSSLGFGLSESSKAPH